MKKETTKMIPGDELHLTMLMAPYSLNLVTGQDRQHLLAFGRAAFDAGKAVQQALCMSKMAAKQLDRATVEQWAAEAREDLPNQLGTDFDEMEVMLAVARRAAEHPAPAISEEDRRELVAGAGLLAGHGHHGSAQALLRVLGIPVQQSEPVALVDGGTPGPWSVRKRFGKDDEVLDCFVTAPDCQGLAYAAEILGDDEYRDGIERRLADCELIVAAVNAYRAALAAKPAAAVPDGFEWWWERYMPDATQSEAMAAWSTTKTAAQAAKHGENQ